MGSLNYSILVVDDNVDYIDAFRYQIKTMLKDKLKRLDSAINGKQAIELAHENNYDYIFMDVNMPELDGIKATEEIVKTNPDTNIIAVSSHKEMGYLKNMLKAGAYYYIVKDDVEYKVIANIFGM